LNRRLFGVLIVVGAVLCSASRVGAAADRRPIILVHGIGGSSERTWGKGYRHSFYARLLEAGYEESRTLFSLDYSDVPGADYVEIAERLCKMVGQALDASGAEQVDIVAHSMGALVARWYAVSQLHSAEVANIVMLSPPNHGSFLASAASLARHVLIQESHALVGNQELNDRQQYVRLRADEVYEPLYSTYSNVKTFGLGGLLMPGVRFEEWLVSEHPGLYQQMLDLCRTWRLLEPTCNGAPSAADSLTDGYYEYVALYVGKNNYIQKMTLPSEQIGMLLEPPLSLESIPQSMLQKLLLRLLDPMLIRLRTNLRDNLFCGMAALFNIPVDSPAVLRLVEERVDFPRERVSGEMQYDALDANWYLATWNAHDSMLREDMYGRPDAGVPRNLVIAVKAPNVAALVWPAVSDNDLVVELTSAHVSPGPDDVYKVVSGLLPFHSTLTNDSAVVRQVLDWLRKEDKPQHTITPRWESSYKFGSWSHTAKLEVSDWSPTYVCISLHKIKDECDLWLQLDCPHADLVAWIDVECCDGTCQRIMLPHMHERYVLASLYTRATCARLGLRLRPDSRTHLAEQKVSVTLRCGTAAPASVSGEVIGANTDVRSTQYVPDKSEHFLPDGRPTISTTGRRATTRTPVTATEALKWYWYFENDAQSPREGSRSESYTFEQTGQHAVRAELRDASDNLMSVWKWDVLVSEPGERRVFLAESADLALPGVEIVAPSKWIVGVPALIKVNITPVSQALYEVVSIDPGREFYVTWQKPGRFDVVVAITVRTTHELGGCTLASTYTWRKSVSVDVLAPACTD